MIPTGKLRNMLAAAGAAALLALSAAPSRADDISQSHMQAARDTIATVHATAKFDQILPAAAQALKGQLIQQNPNFQEDIISVVDEQTLALASRRGDLETESATDYAKAFTEDELKAITAFYGSPVGKKLFEKGPEVTAQLERAAQIWQRGIVRDLRDAVVKELSKKHPLNDAAPEPAAAGDNGQPNQDDTKKQ
ncbi:MAG: DUF2059 domain-containing protein [Hyphomicrobiales bacterium]|nr:DUF2059 domain-containing protein [Hyphomicrobiales bacterium]